MSSDHNKHIDSTATDDATNRGNIDGSSVPLIDLERNDDLYAYTLFTSESLGLQRVGQELRQDIKSVENRLDRVEQEMDREMRHVMLAVILSALSVIITVLVAVLYR